MLKKIDTSTIPSNNLDYYYYKTSDQQFYRLSGLTVNDILTGSYQIYQISNYDSAKQFEFNKPKIEFKILTLTNDVEEKSYAESTVYSGLVFNSDNNFNYYNGNHVKAFININGYYILDPYDGWCEGETYYEPIQTKEYESQQNPLRFTSSSIEGSTNNTLISVYPQVGLSESTLMNSLSILKVTLTNFGNYDLVACFSIPLRSGTECNSYGQIIKEAKYINGAKDIRYTSGGTLSYDNIPYQLFIRKFDISSGMTLEEASANESQADLQTDDIIGNDNNYNWGILIPTESLYNYETANFVPTISQRILQPSPVYIPNLANYAVQYKVNGQILWTQPILSYENNYPSTTLNQWNGEKIMTDEEKGVIVSSGIAAGKKERDNTFSGVMLGDWSKTDTEAYITRQTGIYGFSHGSMSYAFKEDGTGFIGKDGRGRIYFDGDKSTIYSSNWKGNHQQGMFLDVDDGIIKLNSDFDLDSNTQHFITLSSKESSYPFAIGNTKSPSGRKFKVNWDGTATMEGAIINTAKINDATIRDANIHDGTIDNAEITRGTIDSATITYGTITSATINVATINDATMNRGTIDSATMTNATVTGDLTATRLEAIQQGIIAGWTITSTGLSNTDYTTILWGASGVAGHAGITTNRLELVDSIYPGGNPALSGPVAIKGTIGYLQGESVHGATDLMGIDSPLQGIAIQGNGNGRFSADNNIYIEAGQYPQGGTPRIVLAHTNDEGQVVNGISVVCDQFSIVTTDPENIHGVYARFA